ncbi:MAG: bacillithiol biosynthesis cysteine-adding enzyme BshC [Bacteroidota bacterium]
MQIKKIPYADTQAFNSFFLDYIDQKNTLKPFYHRFPAIENFSQQILEKSASFPSANRKMLSETLQFQYKDLSAAEAVKDNIQSLIDSKTFTVTTGHQLNLFTGPLYFIYKIVTVINACKQLRAKYPDHNFVPVYWMASEDHDYDEIKSFRLYGKKYSWETQQKGAVGRFSTKGIDTLLNEVPGDTKIFKDAYLKHKKLSDAVRYYVNEIFGREGLVVVDADDRNLKSLFKNVIHEDITQHTPLKLVNETNHALEALHYEPQVFCRDINFFYLDNNLRSRIEKRDGHYHVLESSLTFTESQLNELIEREPEKFSPNVILRPLYQEVILPNLAYVGGPAEVVYWLQLKKVFDHFQVTFPMLMPRNFALVIEPHIARKFEKTSLEISHFFEDKNFIFNHWVVRNSKHNLTVGPERSTVNEIFAQLQERAGTIDKTLSPFVGAEGKRMLNSLEKIERKLLRAEKRQQSDKLQQIEAVKDALFPNGGLQERVDNFLNFYQQYPDFITKLLQNFDPFDYRFNILTC